MTLLERLRQDILSAGIDHVYMLAAPEIPEAVTVAPYMSTPYVDIPLSIESFQVAIRGQDFFETKERAWRAFRALENSDTHPVFRQSPTLIDHDGERVIFVFNLDVYTSWDDMTNERQE